MESKILNYFGKVAGLAGLALGVLLLLFQGVLEKKILPESGLGTAQGFAILLALLILTFGIAGIGTIAWLLARTLTPSTPIPGSALGVLALLMVLLVGAAVYVSQARPDGSTRVTPGNQPNVRTIPPPPTPVGRPISGTWDLTMLCPDTSALREMNAKFTLGRYARAFDAGDIQGMTELALGYTSDDVIHLTGYVVFGKSNVYEVETMAQNLGTSFLGLGRFGTSNGCKFTGTKRE